MYVDQVKKGHFMIYDHRDCAMFKFNFDIDGAHDLEGQSPTSNIQPLPSDNPSSELEPFAEILIDHLVRVRLFKSSTGNDLTLP